MKESKSLLEVWKWKEKVYEDTKGMNLDKELKYFNEGSDNIIFEAGLKKKNLSNNVYKLTRM